MHAKDLPFGYVQFISPKGDDICLAVLSEKSFGTKSCKQDLQDGTMQTIFSIIPMTNGSIQIRSLTNGGNQCMSTFPDSSIAIENRFGLGECLLDRSIVTVLSKLFFFSPAIVEASAIY